MTLRVRYSNNFGDKAESFHYLPRLRSSDLIHLQMPQAYLLSLSAISASIELNLSVYADEGTDKDQTIDVGSPPPMAGGVPRSDPTVAKTRQKLLAEEQMSRRDSAELLEFLATHFPAPPNPRAAQARLITSASGHSFVSLSKIDGERPLRIEFEPFAADQKTIKMKICETLTDGEMLVTAIGRYVEEIDRGCVIGFNQVSSVPSPELAEKIRKSQLEAEKKKAAEPKRMDPFKISNDKLRKQIEANVSPARKKAAAQQNAAIKREQEKEKRDRENGLIRIVTSPAEIVSLRAEMPEMGSLFTTILGVKALMEEKKEKGVYDVATYVVALDQNGGLILQTNRENRREMEIVPMLPLGAGK